MLANILINEKRYEEAIELYKNAARLSFEKPKIFVFIANAYMLLKDTHNAIKYYRKALREAPDNNEVRLIYVETMNEYIIRKIKTK